MNGKVLSRVVRRAALVSTVVFLGWTTARAEPPVTNGAPASANLQIKPVLRPDKPVLTEPANKLTRGDRRVTYGGAVVKTVRSKKPWQMINPFAPARYGDGSENAAVDPETGKARGVTLFSISFR